MSWGILKRDDAFCKFYSNYEIGNREDKEILTLIKDNVGVLKNLNKGSQISLQVFLEIKLQGI